MKMTNLETLHKHLEPISAFLSGSYNKFVATTKKHIPLVNAGAWLADYMKEPLVETKPVDTKDEWMRKCLTLLGQMNHVKDKLGVMTLTVEDRRELIASGWELLNERK